ncbi:MAG TPA: potassium channel family protein [Leifsonia sp.]|jgi:voltage-gated potassium channel
MAGDDRKRIEWERRTALPLVAAAFVFLICYSWAVLDVTMSAGADEALVAALALIWLLFFVDYVVRLTLAEHKWMFVRRHPLDLASVLLPIARPFRMLSDLYKLPWLRGDSGGRLRRRVIITAATFVVLFIYVIALAEYSVERGAPGSNIDSFGNAIWWACVTMATVGYGDYYPVTIPGRMLAVVLMMGGVAIVGTASATIVNYLNERTDRIRRNRSRQRDDDPPPT